MQNISEVELGLYHYKLIYSIVSFIESTDNINNAIPTIFDTITKNIKTDLAIYFKVNSNKVEPFISYGIEIEKIKNIEWDKDGIISTTLDISLPIKSDSIITETLLKGKSLILIGLGYKFDSLISLPIKHKKEIYGILLFLNKSKKFNNQEYETLKIIANQIAYHLEIKKLNELFEKKCKYLTSIFNYMSSALIIYYDNEIKFINKKAKEILQIDKSISENILEIIKKIYSQKTNIARQEIKINSRIIGYSASISNIDSTDILIFIFQDITNFNINK